MRGNTVSPHTTSAPYPMGSVTTPDKRTVSHGLWPYKGGCVEGRKPLVKALALRVERQHGVRDDACGGEQRVAICCTTVMTDSASRAMKSTRRVSGRKN